MRRRAALLLVVLGGLGLAGAECGLHAKVRFAGDWFYSLVWWSWILFADGAVHLRTGRSLILSRPRAFLLLLPWSTAFWLLFEGINLRLQDWYYVGLPAHWEPRLAGMAIAFATVLPGILETADLLGALLPGKETRCRPWRPGKAVRVTMVLAGLACLGLPLLWPTWAFPLVWLFLFLLAEPWLLGRDPDCLLGRLAAGRPGIPLLLVAAGLVCGLLWEAWNAQAPSHWIYTVPFFEEGKLFEMPVPGFLGFLPFALECWTFSRLLVVLDLVPEFLPSKPPRRSPPLRHEAGLLLAVAVAAPLLILTDGQTVRATAASVRDIPGMPRAVAERLEAAGCERVADLVAAEDAGHLPALLAEADPEASGPWLRAARLMDLRGMGLRGLRWLALAGVHSVEELAAADPVVLLERMRTAEPAGPSPPVHARELRIWVRAAAKD